jgi:hypothetical protein
VFKTSPKACLNFTQDFDGNDRLRLLECILSFKVLYITIIKRTVSGGHFETLFHFEVFYRIFIHSYEIGAAAFFFGNCFKNVAM